MVYWPDFITVLPQQQTTMVAFLQAMALISVFWAAFKSLLLTDGGLTKMANMPYSNKFSWEEISLL